MGALYSWAPSFDLGRLPTLAATIVTLITKKISINENSVYAFRVFFCCKTIFAAVCARTSSVLLSIEVVTGVDISGSTLAMQHFGLRICVPCPTRRGPTRPNEGHGP